MALGTRPALLRVARLVAAFGLTASAVGVDCGAPVPPPPPPAATQPDDVRTIEGFISCVNDRLDGNPSVSVADTVQCLPPKCTITLTMSDQSAQAACKIGECQLPRVLLECPGPPKFMPSYLLCPLDSESEGVRGVDRIEIGEAVDAAGNMRMADIPMVPGAFVEIDPHEAVSQTDEDKTCNQGGCHDVVPSLPAAPDEILSNPLDPFDSGGRGNPDCIIATDRCDHTPIDGPKDCFGKEATPATLSQVCDCITAAYFDDDSELFQTGHGATLYGLCQALEDYQDTRGACTAAGCPPATGPECLDLTESCDPTTGATVQVASRYHCQPVDIDDFQCVADCPCREYDLLGGGKFLVNTAVSMVRLDLHGLVPAALPGSFVDSDGLTGTLSAFNYLTRTLVESVSFESVLVTQSGGNFTATGKGTALVNGVTTSIAFEASETAGVAGFEVRDAITSALLAGGTGEDQRSAFQLTVNP